MRTESVQSFIEKLDSSRHVWGVEQNQQFRSVFSKAGPESNGGGTWAHELVAIRYAAWIDPAFELRVYQAFRESVAKPAPPALPNDYISALEHLLVSEKGRLQAVAALDQAINKRAKRDGWVRNLSAKIQDKSDHLVAKTLVAKLVAKEALAGIHAGIHLNRWFPLHLLALRCWRWPNKIDDMSRHTLSRQSVLDAMLSLHHKGIAVTRESLRQLTGEPLSKLSEHIDSLIESGQIERIERGVYRPMIQHENRPITVTAMPNGSAKIEVGDDLLMLSPVESGCLGQLLQGFMVAVRRA